MGMSAPPIAAPADHRPDHSVGEFEAVYRANIGGITAFFARRVLEPQSVADLTSETFVQAIASLSTFDPSRGSARGWLFGIARHVYARHCDQLATGRAAAAELAARRGLDDDEVDQLAARIDDQRGGRELLGRLMNLPELERTAVELVDLAGLTPREAARALEISPTALRVRLFRARTRLRKQGDPR